MLNRCKLQQQRRIGSFLPLALGISFIFAQPERGFAFTEARASVFIQVDPVLEGSGSLESSHGNKLPDEVNPVPQEELEKSPLEMPELDSPGGSNQNSGSEKRPIAPSAPILMYPQEVRPSR